MGGIGGIWRFRIAIFCSNIQDGSHGGHLENLEMISALCLEMMSALKVGLS